MATFNYARSRETALRLLRKFGHDPRKENDTFIRRTTVATGGGATNFWETIAPGVPVTVDYPCVAAVVDYSANDRNDGSIQDRDRRVLLLPEDSTFAPTDDDRFVIAGTALEIIRVKPLEPAGVNVLYDAQVRG